jgi:hypothetical protein
MLGNLAGVGQDSLEPGSNIAWGTRKIDVK